MQNIISKNKYLMALCALGLSLIVTSAFWALLPSRFRINESSDYLAYYEPVAQNILQGRGITQNGETLASRYPPGYPLYLAFLFSTSDLAGLSRDAALKLSLLICSGATVAIIFLIALEFWERRLALAAALAWATYPFFLWLTKQPNSEIVFMPVFYLCLYSLWRLLASGRTYVPAYFGVGLLCGVAMLIRPAALGIGALLAGVAWYGCRKSSPKKAPFCALALVLGNSLAILPWQIHVHRETGKVIALGTGSIRLGMQDGLTFTRPKIEYEELHLSPDVEDLLQDFYERRGQMESVLDVVSIFVEETRERPLTGIKLVGLKVARSWYATETHRWERESFAIQLIYISAIMVAGYLAWKRGGALRFYVSVAASIVLYFWIITVLVTSMVRYMVPALGPLFVILPAVLANIRRRPVRTAD